MNYRKAKRLRELMKGNLPLPKSDRNKNISYIFQNTIWPLAIVEKEYTSTFFSVKDHEKTRTIVMDKLTKKEKEVTPKQLSEINSNLTKELYLY